MRIFFTPQKMPGKRKRTSTIGSERQSEEREESPAPTSQKRKRKAQYDPVFN